MTTVTGRRIRTVALTGTAALAMVFGSACTDTVEDSDGGGGVIENGGGDNGDD